MKPVHKRSIGAEGRAAGERGSGMVVAGSDSRQHARLRVALKARVATLHPVLDPKTSASCYVLTDARTFDVGDGGAGLEVDDALPAGRRVLVELDLPDGSTLLRRASVIWCARDREGDFVGLRFDEPVRGLAARV